MTRYFLAAGVAALAISVPAASAPHGGGHGQQEKAQKHGGGKASQKSQKQAKSRGGGGGHAARAEQKRGGGHVQQAGRGHAQKQKTRQAQARPHHDRTKQVRHAEVRQKHEKAARTAEVRHGHRDVRTAAKERGHDRREAQRAFARRNEALGHNNAPVLTMRDRRDLSDRDRVRVAEARNVRWNRDWDRDWDNRDFRRAAAYGCPPGLAKKPVACMPPGQARELLGRPLNVVRERVAFRELPTRLRYVYADTPDYYYRYGNGYMYQVNRESQLISALMPLFGLGYTAGQAFPAAYSNYYLPAAYQPFYPTTPNYNYRYANGYVYQVNPYTGLIADVDPLLGYGYGYGQMMPMSYSAYNVPYQYRPLYYDTSDYYYRYAPGAIYQVDPTTSLITAVAALLSPGLTVGQAMPMGYSAYNVPYNYRTSYYDTPDAWYRYANGNIYRVDPTTQLVTALVAAALT